MLSIAAQLFGLISLVFMVISYISKNKEKYLSKQVIANAFYGLQFLCLGAMSGFGISVVATAKALFFYTEQKKKGRIGIASLLIFESLYILSGIFTVKNAISVMPIIISVGYTWAAWQPKMKITCIAGVAACCLWIIYSQYIGAYVAIISNIIEGTAALIGFI